MEKKIVCYNGGREGYYGCSDPSVLIIGRKYEVVSEIDRGWQTDYVLEGVAGSFNSCWFYVIEKSLPKTYLAVSHNAPIVDKRYECSRLELTNGRVNLRKCTTSTVKAVHRLGKDIYKVTTCNNVYIVQVG